MTTLRRIFKEHDTDRQILVIVNTDDDPPTFHVAAREETWHSWERPLREIDNQDDGRPQGDLATS